MSFSVRDLSVLAYANGFTLWHYKAGKQSLLDVAGNDYFVEAADMMAEGDMIMVSGTAGARVLCVAQASASQVCTGPIG